MFAGACLSDIKDIDSKSNIEGTVTYRKWTQRDLLAMHSLNCQLLQENYQPELFLMEYRENLDYSFVAENCNQIVGYVLVTNEQDKVTKEWVAHVVSLAILPEYRRLSIAKTLFGYSINALKSAKPKEIQLCVRKYNSPAIALYKNLGFHIVKYLDKYYGNGEGAYSMSKPVAMEEIN